MAADRVSIGLFAGSDITALDVAVERARVAADLGLDAVWFPQTPGIDALTALAVIAREVPRIHLGTAVVPIQGRHPIPLALQALTIADAAGPGRFTLGLGVTHAVVSEAWFGIPYRGIVDLCDEVVTAVGGLVSADRKASVHGAHLTADVATANAAPVPGLMLAALGPRMLDLAGRSADGTITWMTGPRALGRDVVPPLRAAAEAAGRPAPRVVVGIPVCVTDDVAGARERLAPAMARSAAMPSYARKVAAEGVADPVDLVLLGDEGTVTERVEALRAAGMTELCANVLGEPEEQARTRRFLADAVTR